MRRVMVLLGALSAIALSARANIVDYDADPGAGISRITSPVEPTGSYSMI
jgi:hypothetical protein